MKARNIILTIAAAALVAAPAFAQGGPGGGWGHGGPGGGGFGQRGPAGGHGLAFFEQMLPRVADEIGLTDEQMTEIQAIVDEAKPGIEELANQLHTLQQERHENHDPAVFNEVETRAFAEQKAEIQADLMVAVDKTRAEALQVLTEEQREQLEELRGSGRRHFKRRPGGCRAR